MEGKKAKQGGMTRRDLVKGAGALATGLVANIIMPDRASGRGKSPRQLIVIGNGEFSFGTSNCNPALKSLSFPVALIRDGGGKDLLGVATLMTCCRASPPGNTNLLVNVNETIFEFEDGGSIAANMVIYGAVVFGGECGAGEPAEPGLVNLAVFGKGEVTATTKTRATVGGKVSQGGSFIETIVSGDPGLGTASLLPVSALNIVYLIDAD